MEVVWNGSRHHPGGRQLFTEEWPAALPVRPEHRRRPESLTDATIDAILAAHALGQLPGVIADRVLQPLDVVKIVIDAADAGVLVRR
jgi:hypothetical protein